MRNRREAEILASNLGEGGVSAAEILSDMSLLKELAQLQESMVNNVTCILYGSKKIKQISLSKFSVFNFTF